MWAIHWDEVCGPIAISKIIKQIESWKIELLIGKITLIPKANEAAYKNNTRFIDEDLNRIFCHHKNPRSEEQKLANELIKYIHKSDLILDIHSTKKQSEPFVFQDYISPQFQKFALSTWIMTILQWWPNIFENLWTSDTIQYAYNQNKVWAVIECGQHNNPKASSIAYDSIISVLSHYWFTNSQKKIEFKSQKIYMMKERIIKEKNWELSYKIEHENFVAKNDVLIKYDDWDFFSAKEDSYVIMPSESDVKVWEKLFFLADKIQ